MANQYLALGLFIMLLSFFIILNSMSTFEESKSRAVIESVTEAFISQSIGEKDYISQAMTMPAESIRKGNALDNIHDLFNAAIPDSKAKKNQLGTVMSVNLPRADFEAALKGATTPSANKMRERFAAMLVGLLDSKYTIPYQMDILLNQKGKFAKLQQESPNEAKQLIKTAASYANILEQQGLDRKLVTAGIVNGKNNTVTLIFRRYKPMALEVSP